MARLPDPELARQWRERLDRFDICEWTVADFCELEGCSTASFYQWRRKLRARTLPVTPAFVSVDLGSGDLRGHVERGVEIDLPGGAIVKVPGGATVAETRSLIAAIIQATAGEAGS